MIERIRSVIEQFGKESEQSLIICSKLISRTKNNLRNHHRLKKFIKPGFCLFLFFVVIFAINVHRTDSLSVKIFLNKSVRSQNLPSVLGQGEEKKEYPDMFSIQDNSLLALSPSTVVNFEVLGAWTGNEELSHDETEIGEYVVQPGDTISSIAQQFNISANTILWANDLTSKSVISPGQKLVILPVSGAMHIVRKGDTISQIAEDYKAKKDEIIAFNNLSEGGEIFVGDILIIPGGEKPAQRKTYPVYTASVSSSYFICPVPSPWRITQGLHWYNAIDFSTGKCGSPVYAAAGGKVQRTGYTTRGGNYVRIIHPNGVVTYYGHLSKIVVSPGQKVSQGKIVGYIGHTGHTIPAGPAGCHLHFDVRGAANPFAGK